MLNELEFELEYRIRIVQVPLIPDHGSRISSLIKLGKTSLAELAKLSIQFNTADIRKSVVIVNI